MAEWQRAHLNAYILVLVRALEKRAKAGELDESMADHIERLLGIGKPDPAGEAEYLSWFAPPQQSPAATPEQEKGNA